ncbi:unnamed protein product [Ceutorhynchus assimilis]|uniref:CID domain-containing protein n=1 Tax=Ceutorhynchus assimilis TaxID=467358 RepID=A0A9N9QJR2_9CUCU|nr:unnamed protein product [Ceutorhynchus assimilis]
MANGFTESALIKKLADLNSSSQSIQTLALWLIHHRKHYATVVKIWARELIKAQKDRQLTFMFLANDVIQNSRKKGPEYSQEFGSSLIKVFEHMSSSDQSTKNGVSRLLRIWLERGIYSPVLINEFQKAIVLDDDEPVTKKAKTEHKSKSEKSNKEKRVKKKKQVTVEIDGTLETHVRLSPHTPPGDPPEPDELIKAIQELESNIASSDAKTRETITNLPKELSDASTISNIQNREVADKLAVQLDDVISLLTQYNTRLAAEMVCRKKVAGMMKDFLQVQEDLLAQAENSIEESQEKLSKIYGVKKELQAHLQKLPDITQLPDVTHGLAPLPSAENLFMQ